MGLRAALITRITLQLSFSDLIDDALINEPKALRGFAITIFDFWVNAIDTVADIVINSSSMFTINSKIKRSLTKLQKSFLKKNKVYFK